MHGDHAQHRGQCVQVSLFSKLVWRFYCFWLAVFIYEVFLPVDPGTLCILLLFGFCFISLLLVGVGNYVRNNCHLAANFGINSRVVFLGGIGPFSIAGAL